MQCEKNKEGKSYLIYLNINLSSSFYFTATTKTNGIHIILGCLHYPPDGEYNLEIMLISFLKRMIYQMHHQQLFHEWVSLI